MLWGKQIRRRGLGLTGGQGGDAVSYRVGTEQTPEGTEGTSHRPALGREEAVPGPGVDLRLLVCLMGSAEASQSSGPAGHSGQGPKGSEDSSLNFE